MTMSKRSELWSAVAPKLVEATWEDRHAVLAALNVFFSREYDPAPEPPKESESDG